MRQIDDTKVNRAYDFFLERKGYNDNILNTTRFMVFVGLNAYWVVLVFMGWDDKKVYLTDRCYNRIAMLASDHAETAFRLLDNKNRFYKALNETVAHATCGILAAVAGVVVGIEKVVEVFKAWRLS